MRGEAQAASHVSSGPLDDTAVMLIACVWSATRGLREALAQREGPGRAATLRPQPARHAADRYTPRPRDFQCQTYKEDPAADLGLHSVGVGSAVYRASRFHQGVNLTKATSSSSLVFPSAPRRPPLSPPHSLNGCLPYTVHGTHTALQRSADVTCKGGREICCQYPRGSKRALSYKTAFKETLRGGRGGRLHDSRKSSGQPGLQ